VDLKTKLALYGFTPPELKQYFLETKTPSYRADQLLDWLYQKHISSLDEAKNLPPEMRKKLSEQFDLAALSICEENQSEDRESAKYLFRTRDGQLLESVLISQKGRSTVCVSTQLGCKIGCPFCASGKGAFGRDLTAGEIVEQVVWIEKKLGKKITNVVFMGMGEPLDNFEATMKALEILQAKWGFGLGARRITVSTSGITPKIKEFVKMKEGRVRLSVSLHSSINQKRNELVPINRKYPLNDLIAALRQLDVKLKRQVTFEYALIQDVNDSDEEARGLIKIVKPMNALINIIPYNPVQEMDYKTPSQETIDRFRAILVKGGVRVMVRQTAGRDINAACGQLRLKHEKK